MGAILPCTVYSWRLIGEKRAWEVFVFFCKKHSFYMKQCCSVQYNLFDSAITGLARTTTSQARKIELASMYIMEFDQIFYIIFFFTSLWQVTKWFKLHQKTIMRTSNTASIHSDIHEMYLEVTSYNITAKTDDAGSWCIISTYLLASNHVSIKL